MSEKKVFCYECLDDMFFNTQEEERLSSVQGVDYHYIRKVARCINCNEELDVYNDYNLQAFSNSHAK